MDYNSKYTGDEVEALLDVIESKQDTIDDLDTIRDGASKGATALQSVPDEYVTEDELIWTKAEGEAGVRLKGTNGTATGNLAISAGDDKTASDGTAFTSAASGDHAVAFGYGNTCAGRTTLAQGLYNIVNGKDAVAFGQRNTVNGDQAFAAGQQNEVSARLGVTIGYKNKATNTNSIAIGYNNTSGGSGSVALGDTCESNGTSSTAMGYKTKATSAYSSTFGENTQATNNAEVAMGAFNKSTTSADASEQTLFSFGVGTSDTNRLNAVEIKKNGDVYIGDKLMFGEGLSTEVFTTALKQKLESLTNYDDTTINNAVTSLQTQLNTLVSGNANDAINSFNEIIAFLDGVKDTQDLSGIIASIEQQIAGKQATISDLATIRSGAALGATAVQPSDIEDVARKDNDYVIANGILDGNDHYWHMPDASIDDKGHTLATKSDIPSAVTESTVSGWGFTKNTGTYSKPSGGIPKSDLASAVQIVIDNAAMKSADDRNLPLIQTSAFEGETNATLYALPDEANGNEDDILLSRDRTKTINGESIFGSGNIAISGGSGTITEVKANGTSIATSGVANIPAASTSAYGVTKLSSATNSTSTSLAATASAVKSAYDLANSYKGTVTGVKVNGSTYSPTNGIVDLGTISGGSSSGGGDAYAGNYPVVEMNVNSADTITIEPNTYTILNPGIRATSIDIILGDISNTDIVNEYVFELRCLDEAVTLTMDALVQWANSNSPTFQPNKTYVISIVNNLAVYAEF